MDDGRQKVSREEPDLYLIELEGGDNARYVVVASILTILPHQSAMDVPWSELAGLFKARVLRAVPMPGRTEVRAALSARGVSTGPGISTHVEVNLVKIEKDH